MSKIVSLIGIPIKTDKYNREKTMLKYTRLLVEVPIDGPFPENVEFFNEHDMLICEWIPCKCAHCGMYGHTEEVCKKKNATRKEWRRVQQPQPPDTATSNQVPNTRVDSLVLSQRDLQQRKSNINNLQHKFHTTMLFKHWKLKQKYHMRQSYHFRQHYHLILNPMDNIMS